MSEWLSNVTSNLQPTAWLLPAVSAYAVWRAVVYAKAKRWVAVVPIVFVALFCLVEFGFQIRDAGAKQPPTTQTPDTPDQSSQRVSGAPRDISISVPSDPSESAELNESFDDSKGSGDSGSSGAQP